MQPSSLIFLVIIAIWAAYLLQHWVRRREHLATARSVDRFSDAMRVLERRGPLVEAPAGAPTPRSYAVSPTRAGRPEGQVHRAPSQPEPPRPEAAERRRIESVPAPAARVEAVAAPPRHHVAGVPARRLRGLSFLGSLALLVVSLPLAGFGVLGWWSSLTALGLLVADLAWLRHAARVERAGRRAALSRAREATAGHHGQLRTPASRVSATVSRPATRTTASTPAVQGGQPAVEAVAAAPAGAAGTVDAPAMGSADPEPAPAPVIDPDAWQPVPVPKPTYTMKARAASPAQPAPIPAPAVSSGFGAVVAEGELDGLLDRRAAAGA